MGRKIFLSPFLCSHLDSEIIAMRSRIIGGISLLIGLLGLWAVWSSKDKPGIAVSIGILAFVVFGLYYLFDGQETSFRKGIFTKRKASQR